MNVVMEGREFLYQRGAEFIQYIQAGGVSCLYYAVLIMVEMKMLKISQNKTVFVQVCTVI
jgi:hypothetical protein